MSRHQHRNHDLDTLLRDIRSGLVAQARARGDLDRVRTLQTSVAAHAAANKWFAQHGRS